MIIIAFSWFIIRFSWFDAILTFVPEVQNQFSRIELGIYIPPTLQGEISMFWYTQPPSIHEYLTNA